MITRVAIRGIGPVGGFGCGVNELRRVLKDRRSLTGTVSIDSSDKTLAMPAFIADTSSLESFVDKKALRRIDHYTKMALLGAYLALDDAKDFEIDRSRMGIVIASGYGATKTTFAFLDSVIDYGDSCASPTHFSNSVHNAAAAHASILLKITGPSLTVSQFEMSIPSALLSACQWLAEKRVDSVLFGGVDEYSSVLGYCWNRFFGEPKETTIRSLEFDRQSAVIGEGAVFFLLSRDEKQIAPYGFIEEVKVGSIEEGNLDLPENAFLFLGADGHIQCSRLYRRFIPKNAEVVSYTPLYGSLPIGSGFDIAVAALSMKERTIFASPDCTVDSCTMNIVRENKALNLHPVCCLKLGQQSEFGVITLGCS